ncbi:hypothetical protein D9611_010886 [Ephemerocybe angulata]|uniref:F-box domain-containing protein n=1 Tax=Ephemerocybe angulata TaxID=980116 RepID=A0A8H5C543_9AGAR|nr:hypothetical protein D9611_010886 [Tulosesus angulatus]
MTRDRLAHLPTSNGTLKVTEIASIRNEIMTRRAAIDRLRRELQTLEAECEAYESLVAPIKYLPVEVLGDIFSFVVQTTGLTIEGQVTTLCLVCQAWRQVALATPSLWAQLSKIEVNGPLDVEMLRAWLLRAGGHPKRLEIDALCTPNCGEAANKDCPLASAAIADFLAHGPALDELALWSSSTKCMENLVDLINPGQSPSWYRIRSINVGVGDWHRGSNITVWKVLERLPPVTSLSLDFSSVVDIPGNHDAGLLKNLSLANLTSFKLVCDWPSPWVLGRLGSGENLEALILDYDMSIRDEDRSLKGYRRVLLPRLRTLQLLNLVDNFETQILPCLSLPALEVLDIHFADPWEGGTPPQAYELPDDYDIPDMRELQNDIISLVQGPNPASRLQHLQIHNLPISSFGLLRILLSLPSMTHLTLDNVGSDPGLFRKAKGASEQLLPRLKCLEVLNAGKSFTPHDVCSYFVARKLSTATATSPDCLEKLVMTTRTAKFFKCHPNNGYGAMKLRELGVDVSIAYV